VADRFYDLSAYSPLRPFDAHTITWSGGRSPGPKGAA